jgi:3-phenylpropionate/trans-cinnamate dioxygenase ferredoxin reductase subunit
MTLSRIVIIGAGQAGANVAVGLREEGFAGEIQLIGDERDAPFGRPPLSKGYLRNEEDVWWVQPDDWYADHDVLLRTGTLVERIDPSGARVVLADGNEIPCDAICIATGCSPRRLPVQGVDLPNVHVLRTRADSDAIKAAGAEPGAKAVLIGMGFIGAEVAASLRQVGVEVSAVFMGDAPLAPILGERVGSVVAAMHRDHGVELLADETVESFRGDKRVESVVTASGRSLDCTFVVLGVGVAPNIGFLDGSDIATDNGVLVDARCRTNVPNVFAAGDVANHDHPLFGRIRIEHFNNAEKQGRYVARSMLGDESAYDYVHTFWSDQYDEKIEYVGHAKDWDDFVVRGDLEGRAFVGFYTKDDRVKAAIGFNRGGDPELEPGSELAHVARLITSQAPVDAEALVEEHSKVG